MPHEMPPVQYVQGQAAHWQHRLLGTLGCSLQIGHAWSAQIFVIGDLLEFRLPLCYSPLSSAAITCKLTLPHNQCIES